MTASLYIDSLALWWLAAWVILAAVILLAGLLAQGARRVRTRRPGYVPTTKASTEAVVALTDWQADPDDWFDGWDDGEAA